MIKTISPFFVAVKGKIDKINPLFLATILFIIIFLRPLVTYNYIAFVGGDLSEFTNNPLRVINGELPYRDFWLIFPPGEVFLPAFIYKVFGLNLNILLLFFSIIMAFSGLFSFLLGRLIFRDNFFAMISATLVFFNGATCMYFLLLLISAFFLIRYLKMMVIKELFLAGIFIGLAFLFRLYVVGAAFFAFFLTIFIYSKLNEKPLNHSIKSLGIFCGGTLLVVGLASLALIEIWQPMVKEVVTESVLHGTSMNLPYFSDSAFYLGLILTNLKSVTETGDIFFVMNLFYLLIRLINSTLLYILPFLLVGISVWYLVGKKLKKADKTIVLFFLFWGLFTFPKALGRSDIGHLALSVTPLFFLLIFLLQKSIKKFEENKTFLEKFTSYGFIVIIILLLVPIPFYYINTYELLTKSNYDVSTKYGTLILSNELEANNINNVIDFINKNTEEGDYIFVTPWDAPPFYALTNRKNPTYYDSLIDLVAIPSDEKQKRVCNDLLNKDTKLIIHYAHWGFDGKEELQFLNTCPILQECIGDNFELVETYGHYWIYVPIKSQTDLDKIILKKPRPIKIPPQPFITYAGKINSETKFIIYEHPIPLDRSIIAFENISIPEKAKLKFSIALDPQVWDPDKGDGVTFEIYAKENGTEKLLFSKYIDPKYNPAERKWNDFEVDLSEYAGKNIKLIFSTLPGPNNDTSWDWGWWGAPMIVGGQR